MRKLGIVGVVGILSLIMMFPGPAGASATGSTVFQCSVKLPVWPTPNGPAVNCKGTQTGTITGSMTNGSAYLLTPVLSPFTGAAAKYSETCVLQEPLNGKASGKITSTGIQSIIPSGTAKIDPLNPILFVWTRIGATAIINLTKGTILLPTNKKAVGKNGTAVAAFAPNKLGTCQAPATNVQAMIVGVTLFQS